MTIAVVLVNGVLKCKSCQSCRSQRILRVRSYLFDGLLGNVLLVLHVVIAAAYPLLQVMDEMLECEHGRSAWC
jgi:hypothetical protein